MKLINRRKQRNKSLLQNNLPPAIRSCRKRVACTAIDDRSTEKPEAAKTNPTPTPEQMLHKSKPNFFQVDCGYATENVYKRSHSACHCIYCDIRRLQFLQWKN